MSEKTFKYVAQRYQQGTSDLRLLSFVASAKDLKQWGGVPAKTSRFHGGFQRALGKRYEKIKRYFDQGQASPTSVVVAFRSGVLKVSELGYPGNWPGNGEFSFSPDFVSLSFETDVATLDSLELDELRSRACEMLKARIGELAAPSAENDDSSDDISDEEGSAEPDDGDATAGEDDAAAEEDADELDVGHSKLAAFYRFVADEQAISRWIAEETERRRVASASASSGKGKKRAAVQATAEEDLRALLVSLLRPAMIVDGQHRIWGAYESEHNEKIVFSVNAIQDASWVEQVFQFVVLNKLARPISPGFLTSILNTSLTNDEVHDIEGRLEVVGIKSADRKMMKYLNHDARSPFFDMIAEPGEMIGASNRGRLSDKGMLGLIRRWHSISGGVRSLEMKMFLPALGVATLSKGREHWQSYETWVPYFYGFWEAVKEKYETDGVWVKADGFNLLYIVTMHVMQDMFLAAKSKAHVKISSVDEMKEQVAEFFERVPPTFFQNWNATGLQSGDGPEIIQKAIEAFQEGRNLQSVKASSPLFAPVKGKGKTKGAGDAGVS